MHKKSLLVLVAAALSGAAFAQATLGRAADVQGLVTVSNGATVGSVVPGSPVIEGSRYVTGTDSSVVLRLANSCEISLKPHQTVTVLKDKTCNELWALVQSTGGEKLAVALVGSGAAAVGLAMPVAAFLITSTSDKVNGGTSATPGGGQGGGTPEPPISGQ